MTIFGVMLSFVVASIIADKVGTKFESTTVTMHILVSKYLGVIIAVLGIFSLGKEKFAIIFLD
ncbi:hypothetical protein DFJ63DRAFT_337268 [Scheffersomyces coipomensis]|uniref:uncharacterized protein n=1 Tax=Scheffersomyces coipomensis TaxID=1788519 RepID=UPI00315D9235